MMQIFIKEISLTYLLFCSAQYRSNIFTGYLSMTGTHLHEYMYVGINFCVCIRYCVCDMPVSASLAFCDEGSVECK